MGFPATSESATRALRALSGTDGLLAGTTAVVPGSDAFVKLGWDCSRLVYQIKQAEQAGADTHTPTVAIDVDGTLAKAYDKFDAKKIPDPRTGAVKAVKAFHDRGWRVLINTVRGDDAVTKKWLKKHKIPFDYINENPDQPPGSSDKLIADVYIDDRAVDARKAWSTVKSETIQRMEKAAELLAWQQVPVLVAVRYKEAASVKQRIKNVLRHLPKTSDPGYGHIYWNPESKTVWCVLSDGDDQTMHNKYQNAMKAIPGVRSAKSEAEYGPHGDDDWIRIKTADGMGMIRAPYKWAGKLTGGPSPLSNMLVSGLLGGGLGYGAGWLAERLLPEEYVNRKRLSRAGAVLGGLAGVGMHAPSAFTNHRISAEAGKPLGMKALWTPNAQVPMAPHELDQRNNYFGKASHWNQMRELCNAMPVPDEMLLRSIVGMTKEAYGNSGVFGHRDVALQEIPVDAFNAAIWNDVGNGLRSSQANPFGTRSPYGTNQDRMHTPPHVGAAVSGLVSGVQQMYGGAPMLSPRHFVKGLMTAGLDLATARVTGGVLGALGIITPKAQKKIQDLGLWGGFIRGVAGSALGMR